MATNGIDAAGMAALPSAVRSVGSSQAAARPAPRSEQSGERPAAPPAIEPLDLKAQLASVNRMLREQRSDISFSVDEGTGKTVVRVIRESTGEVVRQIPSEEVLAIAEALRLHAPGGSLGVEAWS